MCDGSTLPSAATQLAAPAPFELWRIDLDLAPSEAGRQSLAPDEIARAARFVFARDRERFVAMRAALRGLLAARTGLAPAALRFATGRHGKPFLSPAAGCSFNLSHSGGLALLALAPGGEIGVDVERLCAVPDALALAAHHFTPNEREALTLACAANRDRAFLTGWTRKEACLKAIGSGLAVAASAVDAGLDPQQRIVAVHADTGAVNLELHSLAGEGWVGALARVVQP